MTIPMALSPPSPIQAYYCDASALEFGLIELPLVMFTTATTDPNSTSLVPLLSSILQHSTNNEKLMFDLGIRCDGENYSPRVVEWIKGVFRVHAPEDSDAVESFAKGAFNGLLVPLM
jgi:hypothetical protein